MFPKGPQMDTKSRPKSIERVFWRGLKKRPQKGTLSRIRKSEILRLFITLWQGRKSQKTHIFGYHFGTVWETKLLKTGFQNSIKKSAENRHPFHEIFGTIRVRCTFLIYLTSIAMHFVVVFRWTRSGRTGQSQ